MLPDPAAVRGPTPEAPTRSPPFQEDLVRARLLALGGGHLRGRRSVDEALGDAFGGGGGAGGVTGSSPTESNRRGSARCPPLTKVAKALVSFSGVTLHEPSAADRPRESGRPAVRPIRWAKSRTSGSPRSAMSRMATV